MIDISVNDIDGKMGHMRIKELQQVYLELIILAYMEGLLKLKYKPCARDMDGFVDGFKAKANGKTTNMTLCRDAQVNLTRFMAKPINLHGGKFHLTSVLYTAASGTRVAHHPCKACKNNLNNRFTKCFVAFDNQNKPWQNGACLSCIYQGHGPSCSLTHATSDNVDDRSIIVNRNVRPVRDTEQAVVELLQEKSKDVVNDDVQDRARTPIVIGDDESVADRQQHLEDNSGLVVRDSRRTASTKDTNKRRRESMEMMADVTNTNKKMKKTRSDVPPVDITNNMRRRLQLDGALNVPDDTGEYIFRIETASALQLQDGNNTDMMRVHLSIPIQLPRQPGVEDTIKQIAKGVFKSAKNMKRTLETITVHRSSAADRDSTVRQSS